MPDEVSPNFSWQDLYSLIYESADSGVLVYLIVTAFVIGIWRLFLFYREDRFFPKIEFYCDVIFKTDKASCWLVEVVCVVRNKGISGHKMRNLEFRLHGIKDSDELIFGDDSINEQLTFPHFIKESRWKIRPAMNERVEANTAQFYRHVTYISKEMTAIVVHGSMQYKQRRLGVFGRPVRHTCNRLIRVPVNLEDAMNAQSDARFRMEFGIHPGERGE